MLLGLVSGIEIQNIKSCCCYFRKLQNTCPRRSFRNGIFDFLSVFDKRFMLADTRYGRSIVILMGYFVCASGVFFLHLLLWEKMCHDVCVCVWGQMSYVHLNSIGLRFTITFVCFCSCVYVTEFKLKYHSVR